MIEHAHGALEFLLRGEQRRHGHRRVESALGLQLATAMLDPRWTMAASCSGSPEPLEETRCVTQYLRPIR